MNWSCSLLMLPEVTRGRHGSCTNAVCIGWIPNIKGVSRSWELEPNNLNSIFHLVFEISRQLLNGALPLCVILRCLCYWISCIAFASAQRSLNKELLSQLLPGPLVSPESLWLDSLGTSFVDRCFQWMTVEKTELFLYFCQVWLQWSTLHTGAFPPPLVITCQ